MENSTIKSRKKTGKRLDPSMKRKPVFRPPTELGQNLHAAMRHRKVISAYALEELTMQIGSRVNQSIISGLLGDNEVNPKFSTLERIAKALDMSVAHLINFKNIDTNNLLAPQTVPVLSWIEVGDWKKVVNGKNNNARSSVYSTAPVSPQAFALPVSGDSMSPMFIEGETVVVDPSREPVPGDYVVAITKTANGAILRQLAADGGVTMLKATNPHYEPLRKTKNTKILGTVVCKTQTF